MSPIRLAVLAAFLTTLASCGGPSPDEDQILARYTVTRGPLRVLVSESGTMASAKPAFVTAKSQGKITFIHPEGETITAGTLLLSLENKELVEGLENSRRDLDAATRNRDNAEAELKIFTLEAAKKDEDAIQAQAFAIMGRNQYRDGRAPLQEQDLRLAVERGEADRDIAREKAERMPALLEKGFVNPADLRTSRLDAKEKEQGLAKKQRELEVFLQFEKPQELAKREAEVASTGIALERTRQQSVAQRGKLEVERSRLQREIERLTRRVKEQTEEVAGLEIKAPSGGILVYARRGYWDDTRLDIGSEVRKAQRLFELPDLTDMVVEVGIDEIVVAKVAVGQTTTVTLEGMGGKSFQGRVEKLATTADQTNPWSIESNRFKATVVLTDAKGVSFRPGLSARVDILVAELKDVIRVPVNAITHRGDRRWCWVETRLGREQRTVETGQASNDQVEIRSGLQEGDTVLVLATEPTDGAHP